MIPACYVAAYLGITKPDLRGSQQRGSFDFEGNLIDGEVRSRTALRLIKE